LKLLYLKRSKLMTGDDVMLRLDLRAAQRVIHSKASLASVAALFYLTGVLETESEQAASEELPATQQAPAPIPPEVAVVPAQADQPSTVPAQPAETKQPSVENTPSATNQNGELPLPLPTVSVQGSKPRPPKQEQAEQPAPSSPPAPPTHPVSSTSTRTAATTGTPAGTTGQGAPPSSGYQAPTSGLTRLPTPLLSTPQTVNVVTQQVIQEQVNATVKDALRNVAGVTFRAGEGGNQGDTPYIRGFSAQNDIFRDGVRDPGWYTRDAFPVQAVEVFKGPASVLFGRGSAGGVINLVSKTPFERNAVEGTITGTSAAGERATIDANGQAGENLWGRLVAMGQQYDIAGRDYIEQNRYGFSPSLMWKATESTKVTLAYIYQHDQNIPDYGIPFGQLLIPGVPRFPSPVNGSNWYGILSGPLPDTEKVDAHIATAKIEHNFNDQIKLINTTRYNYVDRLQRNVFPEPNNTVPVPPNLDVNWTPNRAQIFVTNTQLVNQTDLIAKFSTGPVEHTVASGFDLTRGSRDFLRNQFAGQAGTNFLFPDPWRYGGIPQPPTASQWTYGVAKDVGAYIADQAKITKYFELLGSVRYDQYWFGQDAPVADPAVRRIATLNVMESWRAAAVWHPTEKSSIYIMRGTSFNPSADNLTLSVTTVNGALSLAQTPPEQTTTSEVGAKADVLNGKLTLQTAFFNTTKANLRVTDPTTMLTFSAGTETAYGWEASAAGKLTDAWSIITSYTYVHARIINPVVPIQYNAEPMNTPTYAFSLWTTYDVTKKLQVGFGAFYNSSVRGDLQTAAPNIVANTALVPAWWRFDAMAAYKLTPKITLQFNVYNLADRYYFESAYTNWAVPAQRRTFALTLRGET
jgi:catecholate siderophore receptor